MPGGDLGAVQPVEHAHAARVRAAVVVIGRAGEHLVEPIAVRVEPAPDCGAEAVPRIIAVAVHITSHVEPLMTLTSPASLDPPAGTPITRSLIPSPFTSPSPQRDSPQRAKSKTEVCVVSADPVAPAKTRS